MNHFDNIDKSSINWDLNFSLRGKISDKFSYTRGILRIHAPFIYEEIILSETLDLHSIKDDRDAHIKIIHITHNEIIKTLNWICAQINKFGYNFRFGKIPFHESRLGFYEDPGKIVSLPSEEDYGRIGNLNNPHTLREMIGHNEFDDMIDHIINT